MEKCTCQYCGTKVNKYGTICSGCWYKRKLIRQIKEMLLQAKEEREKKKND